MKLKGISPLEQNVDRIVLGVTGLVFVGALAYQFLGSGNLVKVGSETVPAPQAFDPVVREAKTVSGQLDSPSLRKPEIPKFTLTDKLVLGSATPRLAKAEVALGPKPSISSKVVAIPVETAFAPFEVPSPTGALAYAFQSTISPIEQAKSPELAKLLAPEQPFDKAAVSIEALFDGVALKNSLQKDPDGDGPAQPIPTSWWRGDQGAGTPDLVDIVAVEVERELLIAPDGTTPAQPTVTRLPAPPGRVAMRADWDKNVKFLGDVAQVWLPRVQASDEEIQRPKYYDTIAGPEWKPPAIAAAAGSANAKLNLINRYRRQLEDTDKDIARVEGLLAKIGTGGPRENGPTPPPIHIRGKGGSGGAPSPAAPSGGSPSADQPTGDRKTLEGRLKYLQSQREKIAKQLVDLGETVPGFEGTAPGAGPAAPAAELPLLENPELKVWTHDMTAEPGATYRYRVRVVINNPMFDRNLKEQQKSLAANSLIESPWSDWTAPTYVDKPDYYFITAANDPQPNISPQPTASAEIYKFYYGYYRQAKVALEPGDVLMGDAALPKDLKLANMEKVKALLKGDAPQGDQQPNPDVPPPPVPPVGKGRMAPLPGTNRLPGMAGQPDAPEAKPQADWLDQPAPKELALKVAAVFLDVARVPTAGADLAGNVKVQNEAVLRDSSGTLLVKLPDFDRSGDIFKRVSESAKAGENQGQPVAKPIEAPKPPTGPTRMPRPERPYSPPPGGGGGGGGGG